MGEVQLETIQVEGSIELPSAEFNHLVDAFGVSMENVNGRQDETPTYELISRIDDYVVMGEEVWYFCQFKKQSMLTGRYVTARVVANRKELKEEFWERIAIKKARKRDKKKLEAVVHENGCLVVRK